MGATGGPSGVLAHVPPHSSHSPVPPCSAPPPGPCWDWSLADLAGLVSPSPWGCVGAGGTALSSSSSSHTNNHTVLQPLLLCQTRASMKKSQNKKQLDLGNLCKIGCNLAGKRKMQKNNFKPKEFRGENS